MPRTSKRGKYKLHPLSDQQKRLFDFLVQSIRTNGFPPSIREMGDAVEIDHTWEVNDDLSELVAHGLIFRKKEVSRAIKLNLARARELGFEVDDPNMIAVPVLDHIGARNPVDAGEVDTWESAAEWINVATALVNDDPRYVFALRVAGDSMIDANIQDNDLVVMRRTTGTPHDGDMVNAWIEGDDRMTLKRYYREGDNVRLQPSNPRYQPVILPADRVQIQGKVLAIIRTL